jgi:hypothetical protein
MARYDGIDYDTVFSGKEYLCIPDPSEPALRVKAFEVDEPKSAYPDVRRKLFVLMSRYPRVWKTIELRSVLHVESPMLSAILQKEKERDLHT